MRSAFRLTVVFGAAVLFGGCSLLSGSREPAALASARARWAAAGSDSYTLTLERSCFCPEEYRGPFAVTVRGGAVASVTLRDQALPADRALSVDGLFDLIADAYARDAARVDVTYDPATGHPTQIYIDYLAQAADEEVGYTVSDLRVE